MMKNYENNGMEEIVFVTPTPGPSPFLYGFPIPNIYSL